MSSLWWNSLFVSRRRPTTLFGLERRGKQGAAGLTIVAAVLLCLAGSSEGVSPSGCQPLLALRHCSVHPQSGVEAFQERAAVGCFLAQGVRVPKFNSWQKKKPFCPGCFNALRRQLQFYDVILSTGNLWLWLCIQAKRVPANAAAVAEVKKFNDFTFVLNTGELLSLWTC